MRQAGGAGHWRNAARQFRQELESLRTDCGDLNPLFLNRLFCFQFLQHSGFLGEGFLRQRLPSSCGQDRRLHDSILSLCSEYGLSLPPEAALPVPDHVLGRWFEFLDRWKWRLTAEEGGDALTPAVIGEVFEWSLSRKALGAYFTAPDVADYICRSTLLPWLLAHLPASGITADEAVTRNLDLTALVARRVEALDEAALRRFYFGRLRGLRVLDPTCGAGAFLVAAMETLAHVYAACLQRMESFSGEDDCRHELEREAGSGGRDRFVRERILSENLFGVDLLPDAADTCRVRLLLELLAAGGPPEGLPDLSANIRAGDVLLREERTDFDVVVGNPPYVDYSGGAPYGGLGYATERCGNLYPLVVERSLELLRAEGRLGMIVPISAVSGERYRPLAERLFRHDCWISTYSNRPARLFEGVEQRLAVLLTGPARQPRVFSSPYQHWYEAERPGLFSRLAYCEASLWPCSGMPVKSGHPVAEAVFRRLLRHRGRLEELTGEGEAAVWLHDGPTYWVRALPFAPNEGRGSERSSHYHRIPLRTQGDARAAAAVLSSSTFYFFFKMVSNCRDLGRKEWAEFPIDPPPVELWGELDSLGAALEERLRETAVVRCRNYPSGRVEYEEYYPGLAKPLLDEIDGVLARHYGFGAEELEYVRTYDLRYRMGRNGKA